MSPAEKGIVDTIGKAFDVAIDAIVKKVVSEVVAAERESCASARRVGRRMC
jgi:hypothetical protein